MNARLMRTSLKREVIIAQDKYARDGVEFGWDGELGKTTVLSHKSTFWAQYLLED